MNLKEIMKRKSKISQNKPLPIVSFNSMSIRDKCNALFNSALSCRISAFSLVMLLSRPKGDGKGVYDESPEEYSEDRMNDKTNQSVQINSHLSTHQNRAACWHSVLKAPQSSKNRI